MLISRRHFTRCLIGTGLFGSVFWRAEKAQAVTYPGTYSFNFNLVGAWRSYDRRNISLTCSSSYSNYSRLSSTFTVELQRQTWLGYTTVGYASFPRNGNATQTWSNVGPGTYRFVFSKANDGILITGTCTMWSW